MSPWGGPTRLQTWGPRALQVGGVLMLFGGGALVGRATAPKPEPCEWRETHHREYDMRDDLHAERQDWVSSHMTFPGAARVIYRQGVCPDGKPTGEIEVFQPTGPVSFGTDGGSKLKLDGHLQAKGSEQSALDLKPPVPPVREWGGGALLGLGLDGKPVAALQGRWGHAIVQLQAFNVTKPLEGGALMLGVTF